VQEKRKGKSIEEGVRKGKEEGIGKVKVRKRVRVRRGKREGRVR